MYDVELIVPVILVLLEARKISVSVKYAFNQLKIGFPPTLNYPQVPLISYIPVRQSPHHRPATPLWYSATTNKKCS
jgi:hypothetical protein